MEHMEAVEAERRIPRPSGQLPDRGTRALGSWAGVMEQPRNYCPAYNRFHSEASSKWPNVVVVCAASGLHFPALGASVPPIMAYIINDTLENGKP